MSLRDKFVDRGFMKMELDKFLRSRYERAGFSHLDMESVPLGTRIVIYAERPGLVIGRGGERVVRLTKTIQKKFNIQNPQIDVQSVENSDLDPNIVARRIADAIERGVNYRRIGNMFLKRIMGAGAIGAYIRISGKLGGDMSRMEKFTDGYLKHCGEPSRVLMKQGQEHAWTKAGMVGVTVKIMPNTPEVLAVLGYSSKAMEQQGIDVDEEDLSMEVKEETSVEGTQEKKEETSEEKPKEEAPESKNNDEFVAEVSEEVIKEEVSTEKEEKSEEPVEETQEESKEETSDTKEEKNEKTEEKTENDDNTKEAVEEASNETEETPTEEESKKEE